MGSGASRERLKVSVLEDDNRNLVEKNEELAEHIEEVNNDLMCSEANLKDLRELFQIETCENEQIQQRLQDTSERLERLQAQLALLDQVRMRYEATQSELKSTLQRYKELKRLFEDEVLQHSALKQLVTEHSARIEALTHELDTNTHHSRTLADRLTQSEQDIKTTKQALTDTQDALSQKTRALEDLETQLDRQHRLTEEANTWLKERTTQRDHAETQVSTLQSQLTQHIAQKAVLDKTVEDLNEQLKTALRERYAYESQSVEANGTSSRVSVELKTAKANIARLQEHVQTLERELTQRDRLQADVERKQREAEHACAEARSDKARVEARLSETLNQLTLLQNDLSRARNSTSTADTRRIALEDRIADMEAQIRQQREKYEGELHILREQYSRLEALKRDEAAAQRQATIDLERKLTVRTTSLATLRWKVAAKLGASELHRDALSQRHAKAQAQLAQLEARATSLESALSKSQRQCLLLRQELEDAHRAYRQHHDPLARLEHALSQEEQRSYNLQGRLHDTSRKLGADLANERVLYSKLSQYPLGVPQSLRAPREDRGIAAIE
eukprot:gnl/Trimastix_PCT/2667.p1 GENE.gnl/Trimastix_PCT/2667~~gnl/Trimastix_PCT/2667.p1  ORF type:complete len:563 (+),score=130.15 gnl/Trimastix_PCT/2667:77-1765(+)